MSTRRLSRASRSGSAIESISTIRPAATVNAMIDIGCPSGLAASTPGAPLTRTGRAEAAICANIIARAATAAAPVVTLERAARVSAQHDLRIEHGQQLRRSHRRGQPRETHRRPARCCADNAVGHRRGALYPPTGTARKHLGGVTRTPHDRRELLERYREHVVQHEREPLGRIERFEHDEQTQARPNRRATRRLQDRLRSRRPGPADEPRAALHAGTCARAAYRDRPVRRRWSANRSGCRSRQRPIAPDGATLLHRILGLAQGAEHPVRNRLQAAAIGLETSGQLATLVHRHLAGSARILRR